MRVEPGLYEYYKGHRYEVIDVALHVRDEEPVVVYRALYNCPDLEADFGMRPLFARPLDSFVETVERDGRKVPRFKRVD